MCIRDSDYSVNKDIAIAEFMAPAYLTTGLGLTYDPGKIFTIVLSPAAWRGTFVLNDRLRHFISVKRISFMCYKLALEI